MSPDDRLEARASIPARLKVENSLCFSESLVHYNTGVMAELNVNVSATECSRDW